MPEKYDNWPSLRLYDHLGVPYLILDHWDGPQWTGHCMMLVANEDYGDASNFHELCHWMVATPGQRKFPDYALGRNVISSRNGNWVATSSSPWIYDPRAATKGWGEPIIDRSENLRQEGLACDALALYEPLVGLVGWRQTPRVGEINRALWDFAGSEGPRFTNAKIWDDIYRLIVKPLATIQKSTMTNYLQRTFGAGE